MSENQHDALFAATEAAVNEAYNPIKEVLAELEVSDPVLKVALGIEDIFNEAGSETTDGYRVVEGINSAGEKVEIASRIKDDPEAEYPVTYRILAGQKQALLMIGGTDGAKYKVVATEDLVESKDPDERLTEFAAVIDWVKSDFTLVDSILEMDLLERNDPISSEEVEFVRSATDALDQLLGGFELSPDDEDMISLGGVDKDGKEYLIGRHAETDLDEDTNAKPSETYVVVLGVDAPDQKRYRLEVYEDLAGNKRYELEGTDFSGEDHSSTNRQKFLDAIGVVSSKVALLPYSSEAS